MQDHLFISYNHNDEAWAEWIGWHLEEGGHSVVLQEWDFVGGGSSVTKMDIALADCERTLALLSLDYPTFRLSTAGPHFRFRTCTAADPLAHQLTMTRWPSTIWPRDPPPEPGSLGSAFGRAGGSSCSRPAVTMPGYL